MEINKGESYDLLLAWLSARPAASFSTALLTLNCRRLAESNGLMAQVRNPAALPQSHWRHRLFDPLYRLGHVERIDLDCWALLPPTAVWTVIDEQRYAVRLYGARDAALWQQLLTTCQTIGAELAQTTQANGPTGWQITLTAIALPTLEKGLPAVHFYPDRSDTLLASLPTLAQAVSRLEPCQSPSGGKWERFCPGRQQCWRPVPLHDPLPEGLYRLQGGAGQSGVYVLADAHGADTPAVRVSDPEFYAVARWYQIVQSGRGDLRYLTHSRRLYIHLPSGGGSLPLLVDRPLRLASGLCPALEQQHGRCFLCYQNINRHKARQVARILGVKLESDDAE